MEDMSKEEFALLLSRGFADPEPFVPQPALPMLETPRIVPAGEDLSTLTVDPSPSVRDVRTPPHLLPVEKILANQLHVDPNHLRLVKAMITDFGAVTLWELLADDLSTAQEHYIAFYTAGTDRLRLAYAKKLEDGLRRYETVALGHGVTPEAMP